MMNKESKFYENTIDVAKAEKALVNLISECNMKEIVWIMRNIIYDQVAYYDEDTCSQIYKNPKYSKITIEQLNRFQQQISTLLDLFSQGLIDKRAFDENYLKKYEFKGESHD